MIVGAKDWMIGSVLETRLPFFRIYKAEIGIVKKSHRKGSEDWMAVLPESHRKDHHDYGGERCPTNVAVTPITITSGSVWVSARLGGNLKASYR